MNDYNLAKQMYQNSTPIRNITINQKPEPSVGEKKRANILGKEPPDGIASDPRDMSFFEKHTFSLYLKRDVFKKLERCLEMSNIAEGNRWVAESILSGYVKDLVNYILIFALERIHVANCTLMKYLLTRSDEIFSLINHYKKEESFLNIRNDPRVRFLLAEMYTCVCMSPKTVASKPVKVKDNDFQFGEILNNLYAKDKNYFSQITIPEDKISFPFAFNEFCYMLHMKQYYYCCYWISWCLLYESKIIKKKRDTLTFRRNIETIGDKHQNKVELILWECIKGLSRMIPDNKRKSLLMDIYQLYYNSYPNLKKKVHESLLHLCCRLFCEDCNYDRDIIMNPKLLKTLPSMIHGIYSTKTKSMRNHPRYWNESFLQIKREKEQKKIIKKKEKKEKKEQEALLSQNITLNKNIIGFHDL
jgi:hypothetical protein